jgi:hypothetical protein
MLKKEIPGTEGWMAGWEMLLICAIISGSP